MKKFAITVQRIECRSNIFEVEADNWDEAEEKAVTEACDHNFLDARIDDVEYEVGVP